MTLQLLPGGNIPQAGRIDGEASSATPVKSRTRPAGLLNLTPAQQALMRHIGARLDQPWPDCQVWAGATDRGYGRISVDGTVMRVHRVVWELKFGPIPDGLTIDHLCRIRACCNTDHMELVTLGENVRRAVGIWELRGTRQSMECPNGHPYTPESTRILRDGGRRCRICARLGKQRRRKSAQSP